MDISRIKLNDKIDNYKKEIDKCEEIINQNKRKIDDIKADYIKYRINDYIKSKWENPKEGPMCQSPEFKELPEEMILLIIEFMPINSICKFNSTCRRFQFTGNEIKEKLLKKVFEKMDETPTFTKRNEKSKIRKHFPLNECNNYSGRMFLPVLSENEILKQLNYLVDIIKDKKGQHLSMEKWEIYHFSNEEIYRSLDLFNKYLEKQNIFELFGRFWIVH
jgi:hypothetical protein